MFALVAIVSSSQQLWILPRLDLSTFTNAHEKQRWIDDVSVFVQRVQKSSGRGTLRAKYIFALQAPIMLLTFSVLAFLAGMCSIIFSPLAQQLEWNSDAKVSTESPFNHAANEDDKISCMFGTASVVALGVFVSTSSFIYALFRQAEIAGPEGCVEAEHLS